jgi:hypothetical protein
MGWIISRAMMESYGNSHCSQGRAAESLPERCSDGDVSEPSNGNPTPQAYLSPDKMTAFSRLSRFGMTFAPFEESRIEAVLTSFLADFPARTSAQPEQTMTSMGSPEGLKVKGPACGARCLESFARFDHGSFTWKIPHSLLPEDSLEYSGTWPRWGTMRNGECWERQTWERRTRGTESGFLPTPTSHNAKEGAYPAEYTRKTPTLATHAGGKINPEWTEHLMGWPIGHTDLRPLATDKYPNARRKHGDD